MLVLVRKFIQGNAVASLGTIFCLQDKNKRCARNVS